MPTPYVVIMAGGSGSRFWPASRRAHPKQFLSIGGEESLLRQTVERVLPVVEWDNIVIVTGKIHADHARIELPELPDENLLVEPIGRNTAPCIGWATRWILERDADAVIAVLPADHFIADGEAFCAHLTAAMNAASEHIVLLGLVPTRPETGYGYIKAADTLATVDDLEVKAVAAFVEKPNRETAESYLADGGYLWNSGMFVYAGQVMMDAIAAHMPELAEVLTKTAGNDKKLIKKYPELPKVSIDYGVMEKAEGVRVIPSTFPWSDVGSWDAAYDLYPQNDDKNVVIGDALLEGTTGTLVDARSGRFVAVVGAEDLIVVDTTDALLIVPRGQSQRVKAIVEQLNEQEREELT